MASPVNTAPVAESASATWCEACPGVYKTSRSRPPSGMTSPSATVRIRAGSTGSGLPKNRNIRSSP
jgi:hypothetical protein